MNSVHDVENIIKSDIQINKIKDILEKYDCFLVGGCIRDYFLSKTTPDRDIVTLGSSCDLALDIAQKTGGTFIELDSENQIYRVVLQDKIAYFDISHALEDDILKDAKRRDFTLNSIFYNFKEQKIFDPCDGVDSLLKNVLKTHSLKNFDDDPLRMLRVFRFIAQYNFNLDDEILNYIEQEKKNIEKCAKERVNQELVKLFGGKYAPEALLLADDCKFLSEIFPFVDEIKKIPPNTHHHLDLFHHCIETMRTVHTNNPMLKLAAFCHDIGKPKTHTIEPSGRHRFIGHDKVGAELIKPILANLKFSKKQIEYISLMVANHIYPSALMSGEDVQEKAMIRFIRKLNPYIEDIIELARADRLCARGPLVSDEMVENNLNNLDKLYNFYLKIKPRLEALPKLLDGREIMENLNIKPSPVLGKIINALEEEQIEGRIKTKEEAEKFVNEWFAQNCKDM